MSIIDDLDIFRGAQVMISHHADQARPEALDRMNKFRELGNDQAAAVWFRIAEAIDAIQLKEKPEDRQAH